MITYTDKFNDNIDDLEKLFLSVNWESGKNKEKLVKSIKNSKYVLYAYDKDKLVGLISAISDSSINLFITYLLVNPTYQGKDIGTNLLYLLCHDKEYNRIQLLTEIKNEPFYTKNNFNRDGIAFTKINWNKKR